MARVDYDRLAPETCALAWVSTVVHHLDDQFAAGLAALERDADAETIPASVVDRLDLLVPRTPA